MRRARTLAALEGDTVLVAGELQTGMMLATGLLQLGDADAALRLLADKVIEVNLTGELGQSEGRALIGLALLQLGDARHAVDELQSAVENAPADGPRSNALAMLGLARVCVGEPQAGLDAAVKVAPIETATYADRSMALLATGLALLQLGRAEEAEAAVTSALTVVDATGDRLQQAILRLGAAEGLEAMAHPSAGPLRAEAEARLGAMGVDAPGWRNLFRLAAAPVAVRS